MIAEIIINRSAKRLNRTFDYNIPKELEELIMIGSTVIVPFGKSAEGKETNLAEGYVVGIKENTTYEVKDIVKIKHNLTEKQIELAQWMAKRYFCNVSDCIKQMLTPGTKAKDENKNVQDKTINAVYLKKDIEEIEFDIEMQKIKSEKQKKVLQFLKDNEGVTVPEIETYTGGTRAIVKTLEKNGYVEIIEKKIERDPLASKKIEKTENLYEPKELEENEKHDYYKSIERSLDQDMETRIERHYFNSSIIKNRESFLVHYVLKIFEGNYTKNVIDDMNQLIEKFLCNKDEINIFYLSEDKIKERISSKYNSILESKYNYTCLDELIDDIYNILDWHDIFELEYNEQNLKEMFKKILFLNYYKDDKELYENTIDRFSLRYENCEKLKIYVDDYNKEAEERYYINKINEIEESYSKKQFEVIKLRWIETAFIQLNKEIQFKRFILKARENNYFISDLKGEISEESWRWNHYIWDVFYKYMPQKYKNELEDYMNTLKGVNKIQDIRIAALQRSKPLIKAEIND